MGSPGSVWGSGLTSVLERLDPILGQVDPAATGWFRLADPRSAVLLILVTIVLIGGGRRLYLSAKARRGVARLSESDISAEEVLSAADHGREGLFELFRLLSEAKTPEIRAAAGHALSRLWSRDELIPEEEQAIVRLAFAVNWRARRKYPRALQGSISIVVRYGLVFLDRQTNGKPIETADTLEPKALEWSHRVAGSGRASLESFSEWRPGQGEVAFSIDPADFTTDGPHRLSLQTKVRTGEKLTSAWEIELPHIPFPFEFDPRLSIEALLTSPDDQRSEALAEAIQFLDSETSTTEEEVPRFLDLPGDFVLRNPPELVVNAPIGCDLAHVLELEFEGVPGQFRAGSVILSGQGGRDPGPKTRHVFSIGPIEGLPADTINRPTEVRLRAILTANPNLGWADPDVRSLWPEPIKTNWATARVIRR